MIAVDGRTWAVSRAVKILAMYVCGQRARIKKKKIYIYAYVE